MEAVTFFLTSIAHCVYTHIFSIHIHFIYREKGHAYPCLSMLRVRVKGRVSVSVEHFFSFLSTVMMELVFIWLFSFPGEPGTLVPSTPSDFSFKHSLPDYHYTTREAMQEGIDNGDFIENAEFSGNLYGTRYKSI